VKQLSAGGRAAAADAKQHRPKGALPAGTVCWDGFQQAVII
jgi:hypothetical protein